MNYSQVSGIAAVSAVGAIANSGSLVFYSGTMPATPETALSGNTALVTFAMSATAMTTPTIVSGNAVGNLQFSASSVTPTNNGTATFARLFASNGTTVAADLTIGTSAADIIIASTTIATTTPVQISSAALKQAVS